MADLDTLRPEVADAVSALDETTCMTNPGLKWYATIRAELLKMASECIRLDRAWRSAFNQALENGQCAQRAEAELLRLAARVQELEPRSQGPYKNAFEAVGFPPGEAQALLDEFLMRERAEKAEAELAALKARIAEAPAAEVFEGMSGSGMIYTTGGLPREWIGKRVRLVVDEPAER